MVKWNTYIVYWSQLCLIIERPPSNDCVDNQKFCDNEALQDTEAKSANECGNLCLNTEDCNYWDYRKDEKLCRVYNACKDRYQLGYVMGSKSCLPEGTHLKNLLL